MPMNKLFITGIVLVAAGAAMLFYDHYNYTTTENVLQIGPITATAERTHTVELPPFLGWLLVIGGAGIVAFAALGKKD